jgi:hypothetical protein
MTIIIPEWLLWLLGVPLALLWLIAGVVGVWALWELRKGVGGWR